jgi:hypothetical protein
VDVVERISDDPEVQGRYEEMLAAGESASIAELLATRKTPGCRTDTAFLLGRHEGFGLKNPHQIKVLKARGADPNGVYIGGLARFPLDPQAVVSGRSAIRNICKKQGWSCEGEVNVSKSTDNLDPGPGIGLADDIVERKLKEEAAKDPSLVSTPKKRERAKQDIREKHTPHWAKK